MKDRDEPTPATRLGIGFGPTTSRATLTFFVALMAGSTLTTYVWPLVSRFFLSMA